MTCGLHDKFETAVDAVKEAFKAAVDDKGFDRGTLGEVWRHYQGLQTIQESLGGLSEGRGVDISFTPDINLEDNLTFTTDGYGAADTISIPASYGSDVITFGDITDKEE